MLQAEPSGSRQSWRLLVLAAAVGLLGLLTGRSVVVMVGAFVVIIVLHELGHFLTAKWSGMKVTEFFLGFGPRLWSVQRGETTYGIKAIPAGAYVKIIGMHNYEEVPPEDEARTYRQQSFPRRLAVAVAGSTMHFALALVLLFTLLVGPGVPGGRLFASDADVHWEIGKVQPGTAAEQAGLQSGDRVLAIAGHPVTVFQDVADIVRPRPGEEVTIQVDRGGRSIEIPATLGAVADAAGNERGFLGIQAQLERVRLSPLAAIPATGRDFGRLAWGTVTGMGQLFSPSGISNFAHQVASARSDAAKEPTAGAADDATNEDGRVVSIVGATRLGALALDSGLDNFLRFLAMLNVFIGLFNLVPLLPLDGGHVAIAIYERIREIGRQGRRYFVDVTRLLPLAYAVVFVLVIIFVSSTYVDVVNPLKVP